MAITADQVAEYAQKLRDEAEAKFTFDPAQNGYVDEVSLKERMLQTARDDVHTMEAQLAALKRAAENDEWFTVTRITSAINTVLNDLHGGAQSAAVYWDAEFQNDMRERVEAIIVAMGDGSNVEVIHPHPGEDKDDMLARAVRVTRETGKIVIPNLDSYADNHGPGIVTLDVPTAAGGHGLHGAGYL